MTGALAWQVTNILNKKIYHFCFRGEIARELPGFSPPVCVCCVVLLFFFAFALLYSYLFHAHTTIRSTSSTSSANDAIQGRLSSCAIFFNEEFRKVQ
ncbi:hypothetical protein LWI29_031322 [Acer saccharum]|uniref:Uncharacterized protein n=1 Tax=Acer saccharum TaxID=4024 RepID=A0AA39W7E8_ACESA|nr:hypothetical protein LWI29_031322 [Acer saccharum]